MTPPRPVRSESIRLSSPRACKGLRRTAPDAGPFHRAAFLAREPVARFTRLLVHSRENTGVEVALVERRLAAPHHSGHDARKRPQATHGAHRVRVLSGD